MHASVNHDRSPEQSPWEVRLRYGSYIAAIVVAVVTVIALVVTLLG